MSKIVWTPTATDTFYEILEYLIDNWSADVALKFEDKTRDLLSLLKTNQYLCPPSKIHNHLRKCRITKQTSIVYQIVRKEIHLTAFIDNRAINSL